MALPTSTAILAGYSTSVSATNKIEAFLDYTCPFSKRFFDRVYNDVIPWADQEHPGKFAFQFRHQVQPWHPQSTLLHEAAIAVQQIDPSKFLPFSSKLFAVVADRWFDNLAYEKSRSEIYGELATFAEESVGIPREQVLSLLRRKIVEGSKNTGNEVTNVLKLHVRISRQNAIHVSPTVLFNGLIDNNVSSGWDLEQWKAYLTDRL
ncbi:hypothetical protein HK100_004587 [Physocladia obscura]|uniref:Thioredoxin-like fold domain-containing protein n=1 Tax=Physocladia obscura TaxID=109957 RepID=A0AAD5XKV8_9FUNG|nr:hypothetical protein HK100_004587 [Physocladia obscura]